jgi:sulfhydrogenase subunit gamma (sulfur reductase)
MRIVRRYNLTDDVRFFQVRPINRQQVLQLQYLPGQFVVLSLPGTGEAPFSISSTPSRLGLLEFCIREVGTFTKALFGLKENATIGVRGPYGNGFPVEQMKGNDLVIIVGGLGAAPLRSLLLYALDNRDEFGNVYYLYGARTPADMLFREELLDIREREDLQCLLAVNEDPQGIWKLDKGLVTDLFRHIKGIEPRKTYACVCGPPAMYKAVIGELLKYELPKHQILMTLERRMKCGVGKCGHCVIGSIYTCVDGPVFSYWDTIHMKELI